MSDVNRLMKELAGDGPVEKHVILIKLKEALNNAPPFGDTPILEVSSPQRQWLAEVGALLTRLGLDKKFSFRGAFASLPQYWRHSINQIMGQVADAIEELKLDLELSGRSDFGNAYAPGDVYRFFTDLKAVINSAATEVLVVDPYFDGGSFDAYLSTAADNLVVKILADRYSKDIGTYVAKHRTQFKSQIELRSSKELHDRLIFVDHDSAWILGGSIKDAGKKATYLIPIAGEIVTAKREIYSHIWNRAEQIT